MNRTKLVIAGALLVTISTTALCGNKIIGEVNSLNQEIETLRNEQIKLHQTLNSSEQEKNDLNSVIENQNKTINELNIKIQNLEEGISAKEQKIKELETTTIYNPNDITVASKATVTHMKRALKGTALAPLAESFVEAEKTYGGNAYFYAALVAHESGWITSNRSQSTNNLTGYAVYDRASRGKSYDSKEESIFDTANLISNYYLHPDGKHHNGVSIWDINKKYCMMADGVTPDMNWSDSINSIAKKMMNNGNSMK